MFSFYPTKNMTSGEGGMTVCADERTADRVRLLRNQGMKTRYRNEIVGHNARMTDINAAVGRVQLGRLNGWNEQRRANARFLNDHLEGVAIPAVAPGAVHVYHQYTIRVLEDRDGFARALNDEYGVQSGVYYPVPVHQLPAYSADIELPATREAADQVLSLPVHPSLTDAELDRVVTAVNAVAKAGA
jgi:dTDP-4-amino-4,6-dideoxygalactose transaminase